jgi:hypothetical protein
MTRCTSIYYGLYTAYKYQGQQGENQMLISKILRHIFGSDDHKEKVLSPRATKYHFSDSDLARLNSIMHPQDLGRQEAAKNSATE